MKIKTSHKNEKIYSKYGEVFKVLRTQRGFKLTSFKDIGLSAATLCKFENGQTMIKLDKLVLALTEMSLSLTEYECFINNFESTINIPLIHELLPIQTSKVSSNSLKVFKEALQQNEQAYALAIKSTYHKLTVDELDWLYTYFDELKFWRNIDLCSLYLTLKFFSPQQILYLLEIFFIDNTKKNMIHSFEYKTELCHIISQAIFILSHRRYKEITQHLLEYINPNNFTHTMYTKNLYEFTLGYWQIIFLDSSIGLRNMETAMSVIYKLCSPEIFKHFQDLCTSYSIKFKVKSTSCLFDKL